MIPEHFWGKKHQKYAQQEWIRKPTIFAEEVVSRFMPGAKILDIGAGQGQDTLFFAKAGHSVTAVDFSAFALAQLNQATEMEGLSNIQAVKHTLGEENLPFSNEEFDIVYSHLSLHYFSHAKTVEIFTDMARVLRREGLLCVLVNSVEDPEYGTGIKLEEDYYEVDPGDMKRYFTRRYMHELTHEQFIPYILDDRGKTHKDTTDRFIKLIASRI